MESCRAHEPDLVLLDYMMPEINGVDFLRQFRAVDNLKDVPVIMVTGDESRETLYEALSSGATDFLRKPVDRIELVARTRNMLELRRRQLALSKANEELFRLATTDPLTGLSNRRAFLEALQQEFERYQRYKRPFSVMVIDADRFKAINDTYGHDAGDRVLRALAQALSQDVRRADRVGRLGGEEFAVVLPEMPVSHALIAAQRLLAMVRGTKIDVEGAEIACTISIGVTECRQDDDSVGAILKRADLAVYRAKELGRDRVEVASP